jgi:hypothetical protein
LVDAEVTEFERALAAFKREVAAGTGVGALVLGQFEKMAFNLLF